MMDSIEGDHNYQNHVQDRENVPTVTETAEIVVDGTSHVETDKYAELKTNMMKEMTSMMMRLIPQWPNHHLPNEISTETQTARQTINVPRSTGEPTPTKNATPSKNAGEGTTSKKGTCENSDKDDESLVGYPVLSIRSPGSEYDNKSEKSSTSKRSYEGRIEGDLESLMPSKKKQKPEHEDIDMEEEAYEQLDKEGPSEEGREPISSKLADRAKKYWSEHATNYKYRKSIVEKYQVPKNCKDFLNVPLMNKEINNMKSIYPFHKRIDKDLSEVQQDMCKVASILLNLAEEATVAERSNNLIDFTQVLRHVLDSFVILGHGYTKIIQRRKSNVRNALHKDVRSICDNTVPVNSKHLFGDDISKIVKEAKEASKMADSYSRSTEKSAYSKYQPKKDDSHYDYSSKKNFLYRSKKPSERNKYSETKDKKKKSSS